MRQASGRSFAAVFAAIAAFLLFDDGGVRIWALIAVGTPCVLALGRRPLPRPFARAVAEGRGCRPEPAGGRNLAFRWRREETKTEMKLLFVLLFVFAVSACGAVRWDAQKMIFTSDSPYDAPMNTYDDNTKYLVIEEKNGFIMLIDYSIYQIYFDREHIYSKCKKILIDIAYEMANSAHKKITPLEEDDINIKIGRNEWARASTCSGSIFAHYVK